MRPDAATIPVHAHLLPRASWLENLVQPSASPEEVRRGRRWLLHAMAIYAAVTLLAIPQGIGSSWRECDTQASIGAATRTEPSSVSFRSSS